MDGLSFNIESGDDRYYTEMLEQFNSLMAQDRERQYLITASPACGFPIKDFKTVFNTRPEYFDAIYIKHDYTQNCHPRGDKFEENLEKWVEFIRAMNTKSFKNTKFFLSITMSLELKFYQTSIEKLRELYESVSTITRQKHSKSRGRVGLDCMHKILRSFSRNQMSIN